VEAQPLGSAALAKQTGEIGLTQRLRSAASVCTVLCESAVDGEQFCPELQSALVTALQSGMLRPGDLLCGALAALRAERGSFPLASALEALDGALAAASATAAATTSRVPSVLGGGAPGGFVGKLRTTLRDEALRGGSGAAAAAFGSLLRARGARAAARAFVLDLLLLGGERDSAARLVVAAWPELLPEPSQRDVLAACVAAALEGDGDESSATGERALMQLQACGRGESSPAALHSAVRALELLARRKQAGDPAGASAARWVEECLLPALLPLMECSVHGAPAACRALAPILAVLPSTARLAEARLALCSALQATRLDTASVAAAEACAEVLVRSGQPMAGEREALSGWWASLSSQLRAVAPRRLRLALAAAGERQGG